MQSQSPHVFHKFMHNLKIKNSKINTGFPMTALQLWRVSVERYNQLLTAKSKCYHSIQHSILHNIHNILDIQYSDWSGCSVIGPHFVRFDSYYYSLIVVEFVSVHNLQLIVSNLLILLFFIFLTAFNSQILKRK